MVCMVNKVHTSYDSYRTFTADFLKKPKQEKPAAAPPATPAQPSTSTPAAPAAPAQAPSGAAAVAGTPTPSRTTEAPGSSDTSGLAMGSARTEAIANMEAMGFERAQIEAAMRAAFNNPDRAVEYLLTVGFVRLT